jgi:hypothetical protein
MQTCRRKIQPYHPAARTVFQKTALTRRRSVL